MGGEEGERGSGATEHRPHRPSCNRLYDLRQLEESLDRVAAFVVPVEELNAEAAKEVVRASLPEHLAGRILTTFRFAPERSAGRMAVLLPD